MMFQTFIIIRMKRLIDDIRLPLWVLALIVQAFLLLRLDWTTSPNRTELGHMAASLRLWETGEHDLFHVNPPFLRYFIGPIVAKVVGPNTDWSDYSSDPLARSEWACGVALVKANNFDTVRNAFFVGRTICIPIILLGGWFGFRFASELFGDVSGLVFLVLWTFSPLILGWGATICPDVAAASLGIVALYMFWHWIKKPTWFLTVLSGLTLGLLPLTKLTWIVALGLWSLIGIITFHRAGSEAKRNFRVASQMILILVLAVFTINLGYSFDGSFKKLGDYAFHSKALTDENNVNRFVGTSLASMPVPFPEHFVLGFDTQKVDFEQGMTSYLLGKHADHGWSYYYLAALAVKEPIGTLIFAAFAVFLFCFKKYRANWRDELVLGIPILTLFALVSSQTGFSLHSRYTIPFLPLFYIWISRVGMFLTTEKRAWNYSVAFVLSVLLLTNIVSSLYVYPYSMSYANELARDRMPPVLLGSNLDWGQDLFELKDYLDEHPEIRPLHVVISNIYPLETLDIKSAGAPPKWKPGQKPTGLWKEQLNLGPRPGWFLLGTNDLYGPEGDYDWFHERTPHKRIGYSIYLYHVTLEEANRLRKQDDLPPLLEEDL